MKKRTPTSLHLPGRTSIIDAEAQSIATPEEEVQVPSTCEVKVYRVEDIAQMLAISQKSAYNLCNSTKDFRVMHIGSSIRVSKHSFDKWLACSE